jgi:hypothetical protein
MPIVAGLIALIVIYILYKLFIDGIIFKIILFFAGFFGLYVGIRAYFPEWALHTAVSLGDPPTHFSYAIVIPTIVCVLCLLCSHTQD